MIRRDANQPSQRFSKCASCFWEELFVILQVFADESDTCNGGPTPTICGLIQAQDYWVKFDKKWKRVLDDYAAPYFHFREFADRKNRSVIERSPYRNWSDKKKDGFLYDLAILCAEAAVPIVSAYDAKRHRKAALPSNPHHNVIELFFATLIQEVERQWPGYRGHVMLVFDNSNNEDWLLPLSKAHKEFSQLDSRISAITFADDQKVRPLQAADLFAYVVRQHAERWLTSRAEGDGKQPPMRLLDFCLRKNLTIGAKDGHFPQLGTHVQDNVGSPEKEEGAMESRRPSEQTILSNRTFPELVYVPRYAQNFRVKLMVRHFFDASNLVVNKFLKKSLA